jgi:hypothetical protein
MGGYTLFHRLSLRRDGGLRWRHQCTTDVFGNDEDQVSFSKKVRLKPVFAAIGPLQAPADDSKLTVCQMT